tara:strand:+ start:389 stop:988 length:600 start_codon:yes stop_codon:yes gene_type:complete
MKLIREYYELCPGGICSDYLTEDEKRMVTQESKVFLAGLIQQAGIENGNGRIYPREALMKEIQSYKQLCKERRALGELDHPDDSVINLKNVSHLMVDVWTQGDKVFGKAEVLDTPSGRILKDLINAGVKLGISSRGLGTLEEKNGKKMVKDDFQLICFDIVSEPSTPNAFMVKEVRDRKLSEGKDRLNSALDEILYKVK